jgi:hypothetical protein
VEPDAAGTLSKLHPRFIGTAIRRRYPGFHEHRPVALSLRGVITMRFSAVVAPVCLSLLPMAGGFAATPPEPRVDVPGAAVPVSVAPGTAKPAPPAAAPSGDAAAKHAKRTACLKDAKGKKLVGAEKTAFLKTCIAAP